MPIKIVAEGKKAVQKRYDEAKSVGITLKGYEKYKYRQFEDWEFNCSEKTIKWFGYSDYDKNNKVIKSFKDISTTLHFEPDSVLAVIHKLFCESQ